MVCRIATGRGVQRGQIAGDSVADRHAVGQKIQLVAAKDISIPQPNCQSQRVDRAGLEASPERLDKCVSRWGGASGGIQSGHMFAVHIGQHAPVACVDAVKIGGGGRVHVAAVARRPAVTRSIDPIPPDGLAGQINAAFQQSDVGFEVSVLDRQVVHPQQGVRPHLRVFCQPDSVEMNKIRQLPFEMKIFGTRAPETIGQCVYAAPLTGHHRLLPQQIVASIVANLCNPPRHGPAGDDP